MMVGARGSGNAAERPPVTTLLAPRTLDAMDHTEPI